ncbi:MAG TPA: hypothetical protein VH186_27500 [Chloroflexia bacterium]|nr:hypothetical protein [Chloroflexia bacterium]
MQPGKRIVTHLPLEELWNSEGKIIATKMHALDHKEIKELLKAGSIKFVIADVGHTLEWVDDSYDFWKKEVQPHLHIAQNPYLEDYPGNYFYFAYLWKLATGEVVIALEKNH